jgi:uncharacterized protein (TIGR02646 family)
MKRIIKNPEPDEFIRWKASFTDIVPGWGEFDTKPMKQTVKKSLLEEQGYICCFCEVSVDAENGQIAHLLDRARHPDSTLQYNNMLYSCPEQPSGIPKTCNQSQENKKLPVSPLDDDCEERFLYTANGKILPKNEMDNEAEDTIRILNLNTKHLVDARKKAFDEVLLQKQNLHPSNFCEWLNRELNRDSENKFTPFYTVIKYAAGL